MKKPLLFLLFTVFCSSCITNKKITIVITNSSQVSIDSKIYGSDLEDVKPNLELPLIP